MNFAKYLIDSYGGRVDKIRRTRGGIGFKAGRLTAWSFSGNPVHYWDGEWKEIDTALVYDSVRGEWGTAWSRMRVKPDGTIRLLDKDKTQTGTVKTNRVGVVTAGKFSEVAKFGDIEVVGNQVIRTSGAYRQIITLTERGIREEVIIDKLPDDGDYLAVEVSKAGNHGNLIEHEPEVHHGFDKVLLPVKQSGKFLFPLAELRKLTLPIVIDPDYAADTADGYLDGYSTVSYATARGTCNGSNVTGTTFICGQNRGAADWNVYRVALVFDTSGIDDGYTITQVNMKICAGDRTVTSAHFDVQIVKYDWSANDPIGAANRDTVSDGILAADADDAIWRNTSGTWTWEAQTTSGNLSTAWVSKTGKTYYGLRSSRDYSNTEPGVSTSEWVSMMSQNYATESKRPLLTVLSEAPPGQPTAIRIKTVPHYGANITRRGG